MNRLPLLAIVITVALPGLLAEAAEQIREEAAMQTPEYWAQRAAEDRAAGFHANAHEVGVQDTDVGMWESGE